MNRLQEIQKRMKEIETLLNSDEQVDIDALETEINELRSEQKEIEQREKRNKMAKDLETGKIEGRNIDKGEDGRMEFEKISFEEVRASEEYRSAYLKNLQGKRLTEVEERALTTANSSSAVPTITENRIIDKLRQVSVLFSKISVSYIPGDIKMVVANAKTAANWKAEGTDGTPANDTVTEVSLKGYELIKLVEISAVAKAMTISAFENYIIDELGRQMGIAIENAILNGAGSGSNEPTGILAVANFSASNQVEIAAGTTVDYDDLTEMLSKLPTLYHPGAVFVMSRAMFWKEVKSIKTADGNPIFTYNPQDGVKFAILGYPVEIDDYIADDVILFGDLSYYRMNIPKSPEISTSEHAGFLSGKTVYRGLAVADGKVSLSEAFVKLTKTA